MTGMGFIFIVAAIAMGPALLYWGSFAAAYGAKSLGFSQASAEITPLLATIVLCLAWIGVGGYWLWSGELVSPSMSELLDAMNVDVPLITSGDGWRGVAKLSSWLASLSVHLYAAAYVALLWAISDSVAQEVWRTDLGLESSRQG